MSTTIPPKGQPVDQLRAPANRVSVNKRAGAAHVAENLPALLTAIPGVTSAALKPALVEVGLEPRAFNDPETRRRVVALAEQHASGVEISFVSAAVEPH